jgi:hypothetical protein
VLLLSHGMLVHPDQTDEAPPAEPAG